LTTESLLLDQRILLPHAICVLRIGPLLVADISSFFLKISVFCLAGETKSGI
jgi:hypothetical protein